MYVTGIDHIQLNNTVGSVNCQRVYQTSIRWNWRRQTNNTRARWDVRHERIHVVKWKIIERIALMRTEKKVERQLKWTLNTRKKNYSNGMHVEENKRIWICFTSTGICLILSRTIYPFQIWSNMDSSFSSNVIRWIQWAFDSNARCGDQSHLIFFIFHTNMVS